MTFEEYYGYAMQHQQQYRNAIADPDEETLMLWRLQDQKQKFIMECYARELAAADTSEDDYEVHIKSEVNVK